MKASDGERLVVKTSGEVRLLAIGDIHAPFTDVKKLASAIALAKDFSPTHIWQCGDGYDMYSFSRFPKSVDLITPKQELAEGKALLADMWEKFQKAAPKAKCYQSRGNHSARVVKKMLANAPEFESLLEGPINDLTSFKGVVDMKSHRSEIEIGGTLLIHGWSCRPGFHRDYFGQNVVAGHTHKGGVDYKAHKGLPMWELNCGFLADINALPLQYGESKTNSWIAGVGIVDKLGPRFIAL